MGAVEPCEPSHQGLLWSSFWGHEACAGGAEIGAVAATPATGAFRGAHSGATKRVRGVPNW
eukprot:2304279-Pyramimonas_sp.AAC.1